MLLQQQDALESPIYKRAECVDKIACEYKHYALINWLQTKLKIKKKQRTTTTKYEKWWKIKMLAGNFFRNAHWSAVILIEKHWQQHRQQQ